MPFILNVAFFLTTFGVTGMLVTLFYRETPKALVRLFCAALGCAAGLYAIYLLGK